MAVTDLLHDLFGPLWPVLICGVIGVILAIVVFPMMATKKVDPLDRIKKDRVLGAGEQVQLSRHGKRNENLEKFKGILDSQGEEQLSEIRKMMIQAGYHDPDAVRTLTAAQLILGLGLLVIGIGYVMLFGGGNMGMMDIMLYTLLPGAIGYMLPKMWLKKRVKVRQEEILCTFPDALDLLLVCIEAGQSLDQAIGRVSVELADAFPDLAFELDLVAHEVKAGKDKAAVYREFADRCDNPDLNSFVTVVIQAQSFGTSMSEALKVYAAEMRDKRVMRAEEKANMIPTKMTLGTMMFTLPPLMIVLLGPSVSGIAKNLGGLSGASAAAGF